MDDDLVFEVESVLGVVVSLTQDTWRDVQRRKHRDMIGWLAEVQLTVSEPDEIRKSNSDERVFLYYRVQGVRRFVCVVTRAEGRQDALVATAYSTTRVKPGDLIWQR